MKVSASYLKSFMHCSLQGKYQYIDRLPQLQNAAASFGTAVHLAIELYNNTDHDVEAAIKCFLFAWDNPEEFDITPQFYFPRTSYGQYRERGVEFIRNYHENYQWIEREIIATEHRFCVDFRDNQISGVVDIIETEIGSNQLKITDLKGLALDTPLPTPSGWTTMRDVQVGDALFGSDGRPCRVTAKSDLHYNPCYRMKFDDGSEILCDHEHYWKTLSGKQSPVEQVLTTKEIKDTLFSPQLTHQRQHRVLNAGPLNVEEQDLPLHPYVLGFWLGDGKHSSSEITSADTEVFDRFVSLGYRVGKDTSGPDRCDTRTVKGIRFIQKDLGVLHSKHVPQEYLRGSISQRLELLRGLMDSDGTWNKVRNECVFTNTNEQLADSVFELVASLGWRPRKWSGPYEGFGVSGIAHNIYFIPFDENPFWLKRKADLVRLEGTNKSRRRLIIEVEEIPTIPTQCLTVDSADHTYLCGRQMVPTHNTGKRPNKQSLGFDVQFTAYLYAAQQKEFWTGYDEKYVGLPNGEELYERFKDFEFVGIWSDLKNSKDYPVGPRTESDYDRLAYVLDSISRAIEHEVFVPDISGDTCGICSYQDLCPIYTKPEWKANYE